MMNSENWIYCPVCKNKTRLQIREDTELKKFSSVLSKVQARNPNQCL